MTDTDILMEPPIFMSTNYKLDPLHQNKRLQWDYKVRLIGEKVVDPLIHSCEKCLLPILIYGRMIPCKHVFCYDCAKKMDKICPRCDDPVQRIEQSALGTVFICTHGGSKHTFGGCRRTYLSQRDLQAHINHRHLRSSTSDSHPKPVPPRPLAPSYATETHSKPQPHHPPPTIVYSTSTSQPSDHGITTSATIHPVLEQSIYRPLDGLPQSQRPPPQIPPHLPPPLPQILTQAPPPISLAQPPPHIPRSQHTTVATTIESYQTSTAASMSVSGRSSNLITVPIQDEQSYGHNQLEQPSMPSYTSRPPPSGVMPPPVYAQAAFPTGPGPHQPGKPGPHQSVPIAVPHQQGQMPVPHPHGPIPGPHQQGPIPGPHLQGSMPGPHQQGQMPGPHQQGSMPGPHQQGPMPGSHPAGPISASHPPMQIPGSLQQPIHHPQGQIPVQQQPSHMPGPHQPGPHQPGPLQQGPHQPYPSVSMAPPHQGPPNTYTQQPPGMVQYSNPPPMSQQAGPIPQHAHPTGSHPMSRPAMSVPPPAMSVPPPGMSVPPPSVPPHQSMPSGPPPHLVMSGPPQHQPSQFPSPSSHRPYEDPHAAASFPQNGSPRMQWNVQQPRGRMPAPTRTQNEQSQFNQYY